MRMGLARLSMALVVQDQASHAALVRVLRQRMSTWLACMLHRNHWWWKVCSVCPVTVFRNRISGGTGRCCFVLAEV